MQGAPRGGFSRLLAWKSLTPTLSIEERIFCAPRATKNKKKERVMAFVLFLFSFIEGC